MKNTDKSSTIWIYETDASNQYRYALGIRSSLPLICIGLNPSTAEPEKPDPTVQSIMRLSHNNGYNSWILLNLYPQRATCPDDLPTRFNKNHHTRNLDTIRKLLIYQPVHIWAAWGNLIEKKSYLTNCLLDIYDICQLHDCLWLQMNTLTKKGHPRHPLYLNARSILQPFDIQNYLSQSQFNSSESPVKIS